GCECLTEVFALAALVRADEHGKDDYVSGRDDEAALAFAGFGLAEVVLEQALPDWFDLGLAVLASVDYADLGQVAPA
ncbi:unnamed protein product, partial [Sphagnum balticum]